MRPRAVRFRLQPEDWRLAIVTALATLASATCLQPLLDGAWWMPPSAVAVAVVGAVGVALRAIDAPLPVHPIIQCAALIATLTMMFARDEATWGLPGPAAIYRLQGLVVQGREYAVGAVPPAGPNEGLLLLVVGGIGLAALVADSLSGGLELPSLTLLPFAALFTVPWWIGKGTAPGWSFVVVALGWLAVLAASQRERTAMWGPHARPGAPELGAVVAVASIAAALLVSGAVPTQMPTGAGSSSAGSAAGPVRLDAMASLRRSLVTDDPRVVLTFTTTAKQPDYLRLAVLEEFDGVDWFPAATTVLVDEPASSTGPPPGQPVEYLLDVGSLAGATLPSPPGTQTSFSDWPVVWDQRTGIPIRADGGMIQGTTVRLAVVPPDGEPNALRSASRVPTSSGPGFAPEDLADPEPLAGPELPTLAREITRGAPSPYDAAMSLQRWFTSDGGFAYSTAAAPGSDEEALSRFLEERIGYCEQFAATMALMARSVGIPARVVVGFTQGRLSSGRWVVRGTDAHAWPELWMGSAGWLRFEPTPGATTTTTPGYATPGGSPDESAAPDEEDAEQPTQPGQDPRARPDEAGPESPQPATGVGAAPLGILLALVSVLFMVPMAGRIARRHWRLRRGGAESAYREVVDTAIDLGPVREGPTPRMTLAAISAAMADPEAQAAARRVLSAVEEQRYGRAAGSHGEASGLGADALGPTFGHQQNASGRGTSPGEATAGAGVAGIAVVGAPAGVAARAGAAARGSAAGSAAASTRAGVATDARAVLRALRQSAGLPQRIRATLAPRSLLAPRSPGRRPGPDR
ncbi:MAG: DUF3488 and transglutaminase-like domain-containing protein [Candidatus Nanopelagicales bacterium]